MPVAAQVNLRALVFEVQSDLQDPDPGIVADEVMNRLRPDEYRDALSQILRLYVREVQGAQRHELRAGIGRRQRAKTSRSPKVSRLKELLATSIYTGSVYKTLGQCTAPDLKNAAHELRNQAAQNIAVARQYDTWAKLILSRGAADFGSLPEATLIKALGWS